MMTCNILFESGGGLIFAAFCFNGNNIHAVLQHKVNLAVFVGVIPRLYFKLAAKLLYTALYVGSNKAFVNDVEKQIDEQNNDVAVFVENDRSYVPVRFISESYDGQVEWTEETQAVNIKFADRTISLTILEFVRFGNSRHGLFPIFLPIIILH